MSVQDRLAMSAEVGGRPASRRAFLVGTGAAAVVPAAAAVLGAGRTASAADRTAQLHVVADCQLVDQVRRHLAVVQPLDGQRDVVVLRSRSDGVAALRLVAVVRGQTDIDVLPGTVAWPVRQVECDAPRVRRLCHHVHHLAQLPIQSPV